MAKYRVATYGKNTWRVYSDGHHIGWVKKVTTKQPGHSNVNISIYEPYNIRRVILGTPEYTLDLAAKVVHLKHQEKKKK